MPKIGKTSTPEVIKEIGKLALERDKQWDKITKPVAGTKVDPKRYKTVGAVEDVRETREGEGKYLADQYCTCGHARIVHYQYLGEGKDRVVILDCPRAGRCSCKGCRCQGFVFDTVCNGPDARKHRAEEKKDFKVFPPEGQRSKAEIEEDEQRETMVEQGRRAKAEAAKKPPVVQREYVEEEIEKDPIEEISEEDMDDIFG